ncbi:MAG: hypothetical protein JWO48_3661 [Bryobacterales bacterium]|nr:hypothetical protein [Bryobacterales bacterium]
MKMQRRACRNGSQKDVRRLTMALLSHILATHFHSFFAFSASPARAGPS